MFFFLINEVTNMGIKINLKSCRGKYTEEFLMRKEQFEKGMFIKMKNKLKNRSFKKAMKLFSNRILYHLRLQFDRYSSTFFILLLLCIIYPFR